jgi:charged multivesicular body protein 4
MVALHGRLTVATAALRRKKASEAELDRLAGTRLQLEMQVNTLESANLNAETILAMKKASDALKVIHGNLYVLIVPTSSFLMTGMYCSTMDKVDATMATVNEQRELANEVAEAISNPMYNNPDVDEVRVLLLRRAMHFHCFRRTNYGMS